jgi:hypothetical protein
VSADFESSSLDFIAVIKSSCICCLIVIFFFD